MQHEEPYALIGPVLLRSMGGDAYTYLRLKKNLLMER